MYIVVENNMYIVVENNLYIVVKNNIYIVVENNLCIRENNLYVACFENDTQIAVHNLFRNNFGRLISVPY